METAPPPSPAAATLCQMLEKDLGLSSESPGVLRYASALLEMGVRNEGDLVEAASGEDPLIDQEELELRGFAPLDARRLLHGAKPHAIPAVTAVPLCVAPEESPLVTLDGKMPNDGGDPSPAIVVSAWGTASPPTPTHPSIATRVPSLPPPEPSPPMSPPPATQDLISVLESVMSNVELESQSPLARATRGGSSASVDTCTDAASVLAMILDTHTHTHTSEHARAHTHASEREVVRAVLRAMCRVVKVENVGQEEAAATRMRLAQLGTPQALTSTMHTHATDHTVHEAACELLSLLAIDNDVSSALGAAGACEQLCACMRGFPSHQVVQRYACLAVGYLAMKVAENKARLGSNGACELVLSALRSFQHCRAVQEEGLFAIWQLAVHSEEKTQRLNYGGAPELVMGAMRSFPTDRAVVTCALNAAVFVGDERKRDMGAAGMAELLAAAMRTFASDLNIQQAAVRVMFPMSDDEANRARMGEAGICELIVIAGYTFLNDAVVQKHGYSVLWSLMVRPENMVRIVNAGGCAMCLHVMATYTHDEDLQLLCISGVTMLASTVPEVSEAMGDHGACELIAQTMCNFCTNGKIAMWGCRAAAELAVVEAHRRRLVKLGMGRAVEVYLKAPAAEVPHELREAARIARGKLMWRVFRRSAAKKDAGHLGGYGGVFIAAGALLVSVGVLYAVARRRRM